MKHERMKQMKILIQPLVVLLLLLGLTGCGSNQPECPGPNLPLIHAIKKVPNPIIVWNPDGSMNTENAQLVYRLLKAYVRSEDYYYGTITGYEQFRLEIMKDNK